MTALCAVLLAIGGVIVGTIVGFFLCAMLTCGARADAWSEGYTAAMREERSRE